MRRVVYPSGDPMEPAEMSASVAAKSVQTLQPWRIAGAISFNGIDNISPLSRVISNFPFISNFLTLLLFVYEVPKY